MSRESFHNEILLINDLSLSTSPRKGLFDSRHNSDLSILYLECLHVDSLRLTSLLGDLPCDLESAVGRLDHEDVGVDDVGRVLAGRRQVVVDRDLRGKERRG